MVTHWDKNFASKVTTLLATVELVFEMNTRCTTLSKELCELDDC